MSRTAVIATLVLAAATFALAGSSPEKPPLPVVLTPTDVELKQITESINKAIAEKNDELLAQQLMEMETLKHDSFVPFIRQGLKSTDPSVLAASLRAAASHELKDVEKDVRKLLHAKSQKKGEMTTGTVAAGAIDYLVRLDFPGEEATVLEDMLTPMLGDERRLKTSWAKDLARASIHYLGKYKYKRAVPQLIDMVGEPAPKNPTDPKNPPESYWKERTYLWQASESWVRWALKEITGQEFRSPREWTAWLDQHKKDYK